ncbi:MAG TPA: DUF5906 domain-containing protein [Candidatus Dojkabacteria bacterium]|nr:DUF5906 domain-containing protein [Candidatus Dojkabacteria bacterium]
MRNSFYSRSILSQQVHESNDDAFKANADITIKKITMVIGKLKTVPFMNAVMTKMSQLLHDEGDKFITSLDPVGPLIPLNDGSVFNIYTHERRTRTPLDRYTSTINAKYVQHENEVSQDVQQCLFKIMCERQELMQLLLTCLGFYISGDTRDKTFMIWHGNGDNGKSFLLNVLKNLLTPQYYLTASDGLFFHKKSSDANAHTSHMNRLVGKCLATHVESSYMKLNTDMVKRLTGGDEITIRKLGNEEMSIDHNTAHCILATNTIPEMNIDNGLINRILVIGFDAFFHNPSKPMPSQPTPPLKTYEADLTLGDKFKQQSYLDAFFMLLANHAKIYHDSNFRFVIPDIAKVALTQIINEAGPFTEFFGEFCDIGDGLTISGSALFAEYSQYYHGRPPYTRNKFGREMQKLFRKEHTRNGIVYHGISLKVMDTQPIQATQTYM